MGRREGSFCDKSDKDKSGSEVSCSRQAIGVCRLCEQDTCDNHAAHPFGGLLLIAVIGSAINRHNPEGDRNQILKGETERVICLTCTTAVKKLTDEEVEAALAIGADAFASNIRAALAAKALAK